jgi:hypothetical protein
LSENLNQLKGETLMKHFFVNTILAACLLAGASLPSHAESLAQVDFVAPFSFNVGAATLPAGAYRILDSVSSGAVLVMAVQGSPSAVAIVGDSRVALKGEQTKVTFTRRGGQIFLSSFSRNDGRVAEISLASVK